MRCLLCSQPEKNYKPAVDTDFICASCVRKLLSFSQADLVKGYKIAKGKNYQDKAEALWSFMNEDSRREILRNGRNDAQKRTYGRRSVRLVKNEQKPSRRFTRQRAAFHQVVGKGAVVSGI